LKILEPTVLAGTVALALVAALACAPGPDNASAVGGKGAAVLPFIEDDFTTALSRAKAAKLPLFVEVWAPW